MTQHVATPGPAFPSLPAPVPPATTSVTTPPTPPTFLTSPASPASPAPGASAPADGGATATTAGPPAPAASLPHVPGPGSGTAFGADRPAVPEFAPVRPRARRFRPGLPLRGRARAVTAALVVAGAALAVALPAGGTAPPAEQPTATVTVADAREGPAEPPPPAELVAAPVRIADAEVVRLLAPGDVVDVLAADPGAAEPARVVARRAEVADIPGRDEAPREPGLLAPTEGALLVLTVPRATAAELAGAAAGSLLAVSRW
ncbi:hypothetical protein [Streptomyces harbinensis]|uniref:Flp pilus assembly protein RcpC/CpaB domain-containing protein n=1 Tax=Streptomyces harbinensis TaxID=1176198 RepID=A0A1I6V7Y6_9ACTN|nr:hypothetical protein [Streptomyces harbinensis]SFT09724.1 hypothetical protein SAMN05444716_107158 [Streptomyces harbinensis]